MKAMMSAVQSGDMQTAQAQAQTVQTDMTQIDSLMGADGSQGASSQGATGFRTTMKADLTSLLGAVQSGDQTKAQSALDKMKADRASFAVGKAVGGDGDGDHDGIAGATSAAASPFATDLKSLLTAMVNGDATAMQGAASAVDTDIQKVFGMSAASTPPTSASTPTSSSARNFLADLEALVGAAKGGDLSGAGAATLNVASDLTSAVGSGRGGHHHHGHGGSAAAPSASSSTSAQDTIQTLMALLKGTASSTPATTSTPAPASSQTQLQAA